MSSQQVYKLKRRYPPPPSPEHTLRMPTSAQFGLRPRRPQATITVTEPKSLYIMNVKLNKIRVLRIRVTNPIE